MGSALIKTGAAVWELILETLTHAYPNALTKEEVAAGAAMKQTAAGSTTAWAG
jgi:hypothetical protein